MFHPPSATDKRSIGENRSCTTDLRRKQNAAGIFGRRREREGSVFLRQRLERDGSERDEEVGRFGPIIAI